MKLKGSINNVLGNKSTEFHRLILISKNDTAKKIYEKGISVRFDLSFQLFIYTFRL